MSTRRCRRSRDAAIWQDWVTDRAIEVLGDEEKASRWLESPNRALGGEAPASLLDTEEGAQAVEDLLGRIEQGVYI